MAPAPGAANRVQQQRRSTPAQHQPPQPTAGAGDDDLLQSAPPAFPQPVSSLPRPPAQHYQFPASAFAPAAAMGFPSPPGGAGVGLPAVSSAAAGYSQPSSQQLLQQQQLGAAGGAAQAGPTAAAPFGYTVDGLPLPYGEQCYVHCILEIKSGCLVLARAAAAVDCIHTSAQQLRHNMGCDVVFVHASATASAAGFIRCAGTLLHLQPPLFCCAPQPGCV